MCQTFGAVCCVVCTVCDIVHWCVCQDPAGEAGPASVGSALPAGHLHGDRLTREHDAAHPLPEERGGKAEAQPAHHWAAAWVTHTSINVCLSLLSFLYPLSDYHSPFFPDSSFRIPSSITIPFTPPFMSAFFHFFHSFAFLIHPLFTRFVHPFLPSFLFFHPSFLYSLLFHAIFSFYFYCHLSTPLFFPSSRHLFFHWCGFSPPLVAGCKSAVHILMLSH